MSDKLRRLRGAIDQLDADILRLISDRLTLSDKVIEAKNGEAAFRPGREAALIRRLVAMESDVAPAMLLGIWRQIMAASLARQNKGLTFAVHQAAVPAAIWHMGSALKARVCDEYESVAALLDASSCRYGLVPAMQDHPALARVMLANPHLYIIARTPLFPIQTVTPAYIIADYLPDESGDDISLFIVPQVSNVVKIKAVDGYFTDHIPEACGVTAGLLGVYAR